MQKSERPHSRLGVSRSLCPLLCSLLKSTFLSDLWGFVTEPKTQQSLLKQPGAPVNPHRPAPREPGEFGTWEVNSLIKTVQNPNFAEWQFGGKKKTLSNGKMLVMQHRHSVLRGSIIKTLIQLFLFK